MKELMDPSNRDKFSEAVRLTQDMIRFPSFSGNERDLGEFLARKMESQGLLVKRVNTRDGRFNVVGKLDGTERKPVLVFNGHMDVVKPGNFSKWARHPFSGETVDGRIFGRGAADMKAGLASMIVAAGLIKNVGEALKGTLIVQAVVDEEKGGVEGTCRVLEDEDCRGTFAVVGEPTNLELQIAHRGCLRADIVTCGASAHTSTAGYGINAIHKMILIMNELLLLPETHQWSERNHRLVGFPSIAISMVEGGIEENVIPDQCRMKVDRRIVPRMETIDIAKKEINDMISSLKKQDPEMNVQTTFTTEVEPTEICEREPIVISTKRAAEFVTGRPCIISGMQAYSDARWFVRSGIPAVTFGPGTLEAAHTPNESVDIEQILDAVRVYYQLAMDTLA